MNNEQMSNNKVQVCGVIVKKPEFSHEVLGEGFYETEISVKRLSSNEDILPITISERLILETGLEEGKMVNLVGQFRSYNKVIDGKNRLMLTIFVREILDYIDEDDNINVIEMVGFLCKPPIYRTTPFKREICDMLIAVNRQYNKSDYIPCIAWGRNARYTKSFEVGEKVSIYGRIQSRRYQKQTSDGEVIEKVAYEVSIARISAEKKDEEESESAIN